MKSAKMEISIQSFFLLPIGLGLLGFLEPCTVGGHLVFLDTYRSRKMAERINAVAIYIATRSAVTGGFGALVAFMGQWLIEMQTAVWLIFGLIYLAIGLTFLSGRSHLVKQRIDLAPAVWKQGKNPFILGLAFGLNVPACAAPILFGLLGVAATTGTVTAGFFMMALFGFSLSIPLVVLSANRRLAAWLNEMGHKLKRVSWLIGVMFLVLGIWSVWFGLYVDPADWSGR
jgi:cytochrome c-type biogenesis protein